MRRPWTRSTTISLAVWFVAVLLQAAALGVTYARYSGPYVTTSNAQVDGTKVSIIAPVDGTLIKWDIGQGSVVSPGQAIGRIRQNGSGFSQAEKIIRSPGRGWVAIDMVQQGQWVSTGTTLALAFESDIYVTARVPTDIIDDVHLGAPVDLSVDGYPHATIAGVVSEIQSSAASRFDFYPSPDQNTQNPQRVKEWVPVKITFTATDGAPILPGLNVTARIHKDTPLSASLLGDRLDERQADLRATLPIGRVVGPAEVAALAVHLMTNTALTGATYDIDGGQQLVS